MRLVIATWNIYWLGSEAKQPRSAADEEAIASAIRRISPDVLALQEVVDAAALERILSRIGGDRDYVIRDENVGWLTSASNPGNLANPYQNVYFCIDRKTIEVGRVAGIATPENRRPLAAEFRHRASAASFTAVSVHLKSGQPLFLDGDSASRRRRESEALALWLKGGAAESNPGFPHPAGDRIVLLGDFNAEANLPGEAEKDPNHSLDPLVELAADGWSVREPHPDGPHRITSLYRGDRYVIDLMMFSPAMADLLRDGPSVYAWDFDPGLGGPEAFYGDAGEAGELLSYSVSDHRLVWASVEV